MHFTKPIFSPDLAEQLLRFNEVVYVPAHHPSVRYTPHSSLDESTFSVLEAALVFLMMMKISIRLFDLLQKGAVLPNGWKQFNEAWLKWRRKIEQR